MTDANAKEELKLARSLIDSMATRFEKLELENKYVGAVMDMVQTKVDGKEIVAMEEEEKEVVDIMSALKQSIEQAKDSKKPMTKSRSKATTRTKAKAKSASRKRKTA